MTDKLSIFAAFLALLSTLPFLPAEAQDRQAAPTFGILTLVSPIRPSPHELKIEGGGTVMALRTGSGCSGFISEAPEVRLRYTARSPSLLIQVESARDTTLMILMPDGSIACNDDYDGSHPGLLFRQPQSGDYVIWVGVFGGSSRTPAVLRISEAP